MQGTIYCIQGTFDCQVFNVNLNSFDPILIFSEYRQSCISKTIVQRKRTQIVHQVYILSVNSVRLTVKC